MATEDFNSREYQLSEDGVTLTRVFSITHDDWNNDATFAANYRIGANLTNDGEFSTNPYGLFVKYILNNWATPEYAKVTILYATRESRAAMKKQPNQKGSWEESFDMGTEVVPVLDTYMEIYDFTSHLWRASSWDSAYQAVHGGTETPEVTLHAPVMSYTITAYGTTLYIKRIAEALGKINSNRFLWDHFGTSQESGIETDLPVNYDDINCWLFESCPIRRVRFDCWEYQFNFRLCPGAVNNETWQTPYGVTANQYDTLDFNTLLVGMTLTDTLELPGT